jgi:hypothetical protein
MDQPEPEPEPLPAFTFSPDGPATITYPDGTVSLNAPRPDDAAVTPAAAPDEPVTATQAAAPLSVFPPEAPEDSRPGVTVADPEPSADTVTPSISTSAAEADAPVGVPAVSESPAWTPPAADAQVASEPQASETAPAAAAATEPDGWGAPTATADAAASDSVVNPDGSITTRLPDGSTQTAVRLPGGAMIVTSTTGPGEDPKPPPAEPQRRWRGRSR